MFIVISFVPLQILITGKSISPLVMHFNITSFLKPHENEGMVCAQGDTDCTRSLKYTRLWSVIRGESGRPQNYIRYDILLDNTVNSGLNM